MQKIQNGSYIEAQDGEFISVDYIDGLLQNAFLRLKAKRGRFYPNKNFGSKIYELGTGSPLLALALARQAVSDLDGVYIKECISDNGEYIFDLFVNNEERQVRISYADI